MQIAHSLQQETIATLMLKTAIKFCHVTNEFEQATEELIAEEINVLQAVEDESTEGVVLEDEN